MLYDSSLWSQPKSSVRAHQQSGDSLKKTKSKPNSSIMGTRVYVGGLPRDATSREIQDGFGRYGHVANIWVARNPPGFAFVVS
ncbi:hypothetical protein BBO99_00001104 [Phytophthora kernoviae]|uniref:RRM domain-containing protein n=1 Tax=Phytophthora kernoviae TaxID=325452 RepID=A0A3R7JBM6_9STRA|nr:hypothetical protein BBI17_001075 [Phytophthora kernoviae]RLN84765.1 hypothetical protein BBO99_00001104 [Phytophthora kernoviae]